MARQLRYQPENVCYHVVTRIAHREFMFDDTEKDIIVRLLVNVERFTGVRVISYAVMSNHLHLLLFIEKPATLVKWESLGYFLNYNFDKFKEGDVYRINENHIFTQAEVDEMRRLSSMSVLERYEVSRDELIGRLSVLMRPRAFQQLMDEWAKRQPEELEEEYERQLRRTYDLSAFMKILKQDISQYYNVRHHHTGGLWEGRFKDSIIERSVEAMSSVSTYIDLNPWRAKLCVDPGEYKWSGWGAALAGDTRRQAEYGVIYDTGAAWETVRQIHRQQLAHRMSVDTSVQAEKEEAVFTSGSVVGSDAFIRRMVAREEEAFPNGHKSPPTRVDIAGRRLSLLRSLGVLR